MYLNIKYRAEFLLYPERIHYSLKLMWEAPMALSDSLFYAPLANHCKKELAHYNNSCKIVTVYNQEKLYNM